MFAYNLLKILREYPINHCILCRKTRSFQTNRSPLLQPLQLLSRDEIGGHVVGVADAVVAGGGVNLKDLENNRI